MFNFYDNESITKVDFFDIRTLKAKPINALKSHNNIEKLIFISYFKCANLNFSLLLFAFCLFFYFNYYKKEIKYEIMKQMQKKLKNFSVFFILFFLLPANASNIERGEQLFMANCNVCHIGGKNIIIPEKNLQKKTLEVTGMNTVEAIRYQITNGKNGMPAFGGRLEEKDIEEIAIYVLDQSEKAFKSE